MLTNTLFISYNIINNLKLIDNKAI